MQRLFILDLWLITPDTAPLWRNSAAARMIFTQPQNWWDGKITLRQAWDNNIRNMHSIAGGDAFANSYVPGPNAFNPGGVLDIPQVDANQDRNALNAFLNPNSGSIGKNALIF
jgi:hypothetical protein